MRFGSAFYADVCGCFLVFKILFKAFQFPDATKEVIQFTGYQNGLPAPYNGTDSAVSNSSSSSSSKGWGRSGSGGGGGGDASNSIRPSSFTVDSTDGLSVVQMEMIRSNDSAKTQVATIAEVV